MKKIIISCFVLLLLQNYMHGQAKYDPKAYSRDPAAFYKEQTEDVKNNAEFVFEGFYQRRDIYPRKDKNGELYYPVSTIVKITKVFRGNLKPGTVEIAAVQDMNKVIPPSERKSHLYSDSTEKRIFFCRAAGKDHPYDATYDIYPVDNKTILMKANENVNSIFRIPDDYMFETPMHTKGDVYRYIRKLPNIKMPAITREDTVEVSNHKAIPGKPQGFTKIEKDSLKAIRIARRIHRADSIGRIRADSIELVKKKAKSLTSLKAPVASEGANNMLLKTKMSSLEQKSKSDGWYQDNGDDVSIYSNNTDYSESEIFKSNVGNNIETLPVLPDISFIK